MQSRLQREANWHPMDLSPFRQNLEKNRNRQKYHHSLKKHPTFTKIAKFGSIGCEIVNCRKYSLANLANFVYICISRRKIIIKSTTDYHFSARNTNIYNISQLRKAIFSTFYNISQPYFAILLNIGCSFKLW